MARSSFLATSIAAVAFAASVFARTATDYVTTAFDYAGRIARTVVEAFKVEPPFHPSEAPQAKQSLGLVAAKAFKQRIEGRDRPNVTPRWRMCPSA